MSEQKKELYEAGIIDTTDGKPPADFDGPAPQPVKNDGSGQHAAYWILSAAEREKGFVRPVRESYQHVGKPTPAYPLRDLTPEEAATFADVGYVKYEEYPWCEDSSLLGRFWTQDELDRIGKGCGTVTRMSRAIAETYARNPHYYGSTMCVGCRTHLPVGADGEFVWTDTTERVGT